MSSAAAVEADVTENYWTKLTGRRFSRRSAMQQGSIATLGLAAIAAGACSSNSNNNNNKATNSNNKSASNTASNSAAGTQTASAGNPPAAGQLFNTADKISLAPDLTKIYSGTPQSGGALHLVLGGGTPDQYDPIRDAGYPGLQVMGGALSSLIRSHYPILGKVTTVGDLAQKWEQPDHQTYTFHLQPNAKWQNVAPTNGRALTSQDIKLNFDYIRTNAPDFVLAPMFAMIDSVDTPDPQTVTVKTSFPYAFLLENLGDIWAKVIPQEQYSGDLAKQKPVGSGPFIFDTFTPGVEYILKKNPDYYLKGQPYVDEIHWHEFDPGNPNLVDSAFQAKQIDVYGNLTNLGLAMMKKMPEANWGFRYGVLNPIMLNNSAAPFNDERVRQAVQMSVNNDTIIKITNQGYGRPGQYVGLWNNEYLLADSDLPKRDVQKAKQLLSAAGHGSGLNVTDKTFQGGQLGFGTLQVQEALAEAGIKMDIQQQQWADWRVNVYGIKGDFQLTMGGEFDYLSVDRQLWNAYYSKGAANNRHVNDPALDKMLDDARSEFDHPTQLTKYKAIQKYLFDHAISIALPLGTSPVASQPWVKGWYFDWSAGCLFEANFFDQVWLAPH
jgi:peptide/nickel transport system substrate-binding protein